MLIDNHDRVISYLRISVTDRCNFRCVYCMAEEGVDLAPKANLLTFDEIARVARVGVDLGLTKIRITGGEPTVRRGLPELVHTLAAIPGIAEIAMTTNGARLSELAAPLKAAGLGRLNISLDTLRPETSFKLSRRDELAAVLEGIEAARRAGFTGLKLNTVVIRGVNDDELCQLVHYAASHDAEIRFIEYMPMGAARFDAGNLTVMATEMRERLGNEFDLAPDQRSEHDPARGWVCRRGGARIGFITSMSENFCAACNRMRLTAEGGLRPCLHQDAEVSLREILRRGASDQEIENAFRAAAASKWAGHHMTDVIPLYSLKEMVSIGG